MSIEGEDGTMAIVGRVGDRGRAGEGRRGERGDVFPALGMFIITGVVLGGVAGILIAGPVGRAGSSLAMGTIMGLFVGLSLGVWRIGLPAPAPRPEREPVHQVDPAPELWDPWLDSG